MERTARTLYGVALLLLLLGLVLRVTPAPAGTGAPASARGEPSGSPSRMIRAELPGAQQAIAEGNLFSPSRSAPRVRFVPPDLAPSANVEAPGRRGPSPNPLRLFGTVLGQSGTAALIDADPAVRGAEIYELGDVVAGRRIVAVSESTVVLDGAAGRIVLRLQPTRKPTR